MKLGIIARADKTGLGNQTRELVDMLKPDKLLIIDSTSFKPGTQQHFDWYKNHNAKAITNGFPNNREKRWFLQGIDALITCEIPYGYDLIAEANRRGIKSYIQYNYEFLDYLQHDLPLPTKLISPSSWHVSTVEKKLGVEPVILRPPITTDNFSTAKEKNLTRTGKRRFLHIEGLKAINDRNGTETLLEALKYTKADFELVIKSQSKDSVRHTDSRVVYDNSNPENNADLYYDFDAMIMPRRYGGLCLPMNEALASGLPVIMTDVSPNDDLLPKKWLLPAHKIGSFMTRAEIDIYTVDPRELATMIDRFCTMTDEELIADKNLSFKIAYVNLDSSNLVEKYKEIIGV